MSLKPLFVAVTAGLALTACSSNPTTESTDAAPTTQSGSLTIDVIGRHTSGIFDESAAEIVAYHEYSGFAYLTNGATGEITAVSLNRLPNEAAADPIRLNNLGERRGDVPDQVWVADPYTGHKKVVIGGANSLAVHGNMLAIAVENDNKVDRGAVLFYQLNAKGDTTFIKAVQAGALPDMVTFSPSGRFALVANEGEPSDDYMIDPEGSVTVIPINLGEPADLGIQLNFNAFDDNHHPDIITGNNPDPGYTRLSQDLEPEYITVSDDSRTAYVSLQENNALARISLTGEPRVTGLFPLGFKDHSLAGNALDANKDDEVANLHTHEKLFGTYHPDSIAAYRVNGEDYIITANEGDAREYFFDVDSEADCTGPLPNGIYDYDEDDGCLAYTDETEIGDVELDSSAHSLSAIGDLKMLSVRGDTDGDGDYDEVYAFGARSFAIFDSIGQQVYDSGDLLERITAEAHPDFFNTTDNELAIDDRSDNKGPEPEALTLGRLGDRTLAFVGLERMGGFIVADVTDPMNVQYLDYVNNRNFNAVEATEDGEVTEATLADAGDLAPEGMRFVPLEASPIGEALLIVANEVSGTTTVYRIRE
ncbi:choice-of-anchor I family protein [Saccharospirillum salsuginis]|uniref:Alkaline phosphatase n=1 Tax=Saccharospirillum salsuginis TaxID=418750 RepID=A0A918KC36_9GAMM|nr:choice-of-anchor I family protein [Saccharospirillum salsuginis]GGX58090.1 alkaline phosphatase [Saccharospirillum salsuginis]